MKLYYQNTINNKLLCGLKKQENKCKDLNQEQSNHYFKVHLLKLHRSFGIIGLYQVLFTLELHLFFLLH